jgi:SPP1 family predicted phage head-tail adaptor
MKAGDLRHKVTIQQSLPDRDSYGTEVPRWSDFATVWAEVKDISGREYTAMQQAISNIAVRVRIRYLGGVVPTMRVIYGSRTLDIVSVIDPDGRLIELHLMCQEIR